MLRWVGIVAAVLLLAGVPSASAVPAKQCPSVTVGTSAYVVTAHGVSCRYARKWVKRYLRSKRHPRHWKCTPPSGVTNVRVHCQGATKPKGDQAFRYYYGIKS